MGLCVTSSLSTYQPALLWGDALTAARGCEVVASSQTASYEASRLLNQNRDDSWRSGSLIQRKLDGDAAPDGSTNFVIQFNLGSPRTLSGLVLVDHNIRHPIAAVRVYRGEPTFFDKVVEVLDYDPVIRARFEDYTYPTFDYNMGPRPGLVDRLEDQKRLLTYIDFGGRFPGVTHVKIEISDRYVGEEFDPQKEDYYQIAYALAGEWFQPPGGVRQGWSFEGEDLAIVSRGPQGNKEGREQGRLKRITFDFAYLEQSDAWDRVISEFHEELGVLAPIFVLPRPRFTGRFNAHAFVGKADDLPPIRERSAMETYNSAWTITESK